ncbi:MAG: hypothetical protein MJ175_08885 [Clostridia bacterium]|nr:hypothetical protein [Clostridia bacterium]
MKKFSRLLTIILSVMMIAACTVSAGKYDDAVTGLTFTEFAYYDGEMDAAGMRAFTVDPSGKYYYGGFLNGSAPTVYQFDAATGKEVCSYVFNEDEDPGAYIKAIAADTRGYVYMGVANKANNGAVYFAICKEQGLQEIKWVKIEIEGKVGVNGADILEKDGKVYLYFVTNYDSDRIYCYDVTDVNNPVLNTSFGNGAGGGYVDLANTFPITDCNNICVSADGMIYMAANTGKGSKGDTVIKIDYTGTGYMYDHAVDECFGVTALRGYLVVTTYQSDGSLIYILNQEDLSEVTHYEGNLGNLPQAGVINDRLYVASQGPDAVLVSNQIVFPVEEEPAPDVPAAEDDAAADTDAPAAEGSTDAAPAPTSPKTADAGIVLAAVVMACAAAVVTKKH